MKKIFISSIILATFFGITSCAFGWDLLKKSETKPYKNEDNIIHIFDKKPQEHTIELLPTMNSDSKADNRIWVGTFQIVWNEVIDNLIKSPIEFVDEENKTASDLNKKEFTKNDISEDSYYTKWGIIKPDLKNEIEKGIKEKFNETSDILDSLDFTYNPEKYLFYAMLKKDFKFLTPFDKLDEEKFGTNENKVKYFGIDVNSSWNLYKNVSVLFYNSHEDFAVSIHTKGNDEVLLYRTSDDKKFNEYYADIKEKTQDFDGSQFFGDYDRLKVPEINLYQITNFPEVEGKLIKGTDFVIDKTLETVDFKMNNEGVKLKSEAIIMMTQTAMPGPPPKIRKFYFNDTFVLFLIEKGKTTPYFALRVNDVETLNNTGKSD